MNLGFRKWTGISLLISALLMVLTIAFQIAHGVNPFDEPAELLPKIDDESVLWVANYAAGMAIPLFLLPVFVLLATDANSGARQWGLFATGLAAIHIAILGIAYGSQILLVPLASDVAGATDTELATIYAQADTLHHAWVIFTMISGLPMAIALWVLGVVTFRTRMIPRWLGIVAVVLGVGYMPPLASGENPLVPPLLLVLTVGTAYILLRRPPSHVSRPEAPPTTITASNTA